MQPSRNLWPLGILGAFVIFFIGMATVIVIAATHRDSLVNANYYEQELKFQEQIDSAARAHKSGANLAFVAAAGRVTLTLPVSLLAQNFSGTIHLYRPSDSRLDREFRLEPLADGSQTVDVSRLAAGLWLVRAQWNAGGEQYFLEQKITVPGN